MDLMFKGFSKLSREERYSLLKKMGLLSKSDLQLLKKSSFLPKDLAEDFIENSLGYFPMPYGVVTHMAVNGVERLVPMAVEETSIIAAASKTAKWIKESKGSIKTRRVSKMGVGQIQIAILRNNSKAEIENLLCEKKQEWIDLCNSSVVLSLYNRGGGVKDFKVRFIKRPDDRIMMVLHVHVDTCEAMGANVINQVCEFMKSVLEEDLNEEVNMCILSNLADTNLTEVSIELEVNDELGAKVEEASLFAELDPYRASTNNKGIMNAIDSVLIATGNDWRAVEAGVHAFIGSSQSYTSLSRWRFFTSTSTPTPTPTPTSTSTPKNQDQEQHQKQGKDQHQKQGQEQHQKQGKEQHQKQGKEQHQKQGKDQHQKQGKDQKGILKGTMTIPMSIGTVGGVTTLHPFAKLSIKFLKSNNVSDLSGVIAAVGLVQNLGALRALTTVGIIEGHMRLHIRNLALGAGAKKEETPALQQRLEQILKLTKRITLSQAIEALNEIRQKIYTGSQDLTSVVQTKHESSRFQSTK